MSYQSQVENLKRDISNALLNSSIDYLRIGMKTYHESERLSWSSFQPAIGNLCISIELLIKHLVAKHSLRDLYKNLPLEVKIYLSCPDKIPNAAAINKFLLDLKSFDFKTIEFDEAVSIFYILYPEKKQIFRPYLSLISKVRNISVHASVPQFQIYDLQRIVYVLLSLFEQLMVDKVIGKYSLSTDDKKYFNFIKRYDEERTLSVKKKIEGAKSKIKKSENLGIHISHLDEWEYFVIECPICNSDGICEGYTELESEEGEDGIEPSLWFRADSFYCGNCKLDLIDIKN